jgi:hypothetical protein
MTDRVDRVRIIFYGCSHRPKVSAMSAPKTGTLHYCSPCRRNRKVLGMETTWLKASLRCQACSYTYVNGTEERVLGRKAIMALAVKHANSRIHRVDVLHDGICDEVHPAANGQLPLIDDLLLP